MDVKAVLHGVFTEESARGAKLRAMTRRLAHNPGYDVDLSMQEWIDARRRNHRDEPSFTLDELRLVTNTAWFIRDNQ